MTILQTLSLPPHMTVLLSPFKLISNRNCVDRSMQKSALLFELHACVTEENMAFNKDSITVEFRILRCCDHDKKFSFGAFHL